MPDIDRFSTEYLVRRLGPEDVEQIYELSCGNPLFYEYCPPFVTRESVLEDMTALPEGTAPEQKYYVGYFQADRLLAVLDLIAGYPAERTAFIGLFMTAAGARGRGLGTELMTGLFGHLRDSGFEAVRLAWAKGNPQAEHFWRKNGFVPCLEGQFGETPVVLAERKLEV